MDWQAAAVWGERAVTYSVRFWLLFIAASATAMSAYVLIYRAIVPDASHVAPVHFTFGDALPPAGEVQLGEPIMAPGQAYSISLLLDMPESEPNLLAGNFMVRLSLHTAANATLLETRRPAILRYRSGLVHTLSTLAFLPFLLIGRTEERQLLTVPLLEHFDNPRKEPAAYARVSLSNPALQLYGARVHVDAIFQGLSYYMHTHRIATALVFVSVIIFLQFIVVAMGLLQARGGGAEPRTRPAGQEPARRQATAPPSAGEVRRRAPAEGGGRDEN